MSLSPEKRTRVTLTLADVISLQKGKPTGAALAKLSMAKFKLDQMERFDDSQVAENLKSFSQDKVKDLAAQREEAFTSAAVVGWESLSPEEKELALFHMYHKDLMEPDQVAEFETKYLL